MSAAALTPPLARRASLRHNTAAACHSAQEEAQSDVSTPHRQAGRRAAAPIHVSGDMRACVSICNTQWFVYIHIYIYVNGCYWLLVCLCLSLSVSWIRTISQPGLHWNGAEGWEWSFSVWTWYCGTAPTCSALRRCQKCSLSHRHSLTLVPSLERQDHGAMAAKSFVSHRNNSKIRSIPLDAPKGSPRLELCNAVWVCVVGCVRVLNMYVLIVGT